MRHSHQIPPEECSRAVTRRETPFSPEWTPAFERSRSTHRTDPRSPRHHVNAKRRQPDTDIQALMEAAPHEEPEQSTVAALEIRELLAKAVDGLEVRQKWIFEAHHYRGLSFRQIAAELSVSKTTADRVYREALTQLRSFLGETPE